jgi:hypothetical protein
VRSEPLDLQIGSRPGGVNGRQGVDTGRGGDACRLPDDIVAICWRRCGPCRGLHLPRLVEEVLDGLAVFLHFTDMTLLDEVVPQLVWHWPPPRRSHRLPHIYHL